jgi:cytochrome P450
LTNLIWRLLEKPERWQAVCANPDLHMIAVEEALRHDSPAQAMWRTSLCPVSLHGVDIPAKSKLMVNYGAANRDHEVFTDAEEFRLDRPLDELRKHVAFSAGPHACPGAPVGRLELTTALRVLTQRLPKLRLNGPSERIGAYNFWGRRHLPLAWD